MELSRLEQQMNFLIEIDKLKTIYRQNYLADGSRKENDAEHSWHLAMMIITLSEYFPLADTLRTLKLVLIHDLVEIYAGDTFAYDDKANVDKKVREERAANKVFSLLPSEEAHEYLSMWQEFELMESPEAVFAAIVDRLQPLTLNASSHGKMWLEHGVKVEKVLQRNAILFEKAHPVVAEYVRKIIADASMRQYFA